ncbi:MAG TPA: LuxR C-terminal-related transcriptional regulator [Pyrinomonadaceae bacterium]|nr:LuxR C-terminal-related transcriptional regulator [Pyrinomonadaceae bacterium]
MAFAARSTNPTSRVLLDDNQALVRAGMGVLLEEIRGLKEMFVSSQLENKASSREATRGEEIQLHELTPRQRQVLRMLVDGHSTKSIALSLNISVKTAETHRAQLMERLDIHDLPSLVRYAIRIGLIKA